MFDSSKPFGSSKRPLVLLFVGLLLGALVGAGLLAAWWLRPTAQPVFAVDEGWTDLMRAAREGDAAAVRRLLEKGGDPNVRGGKLGLTPLIVAAGNGHREIVDLLALRGASLEAADSAGMTPLMNAAMFDQAAVVQLLLDRGADVNAQTADGAMTPLMFARSPAIAKMLLLAGADARARTRDGKTAADGAETLGRTELAELLRLAERQPAAPHKKSLAAAAAPAATTAAGSAASAEPPLRTQTEPTPPRMPDAQVVRQPAASAEPPADPLENWRGAAEAVP